MVSARAIARAWDYHPPCGLLFGFYCLRFLVEVLAVGIAWRVRSHALSSALHHLSFSQFIQRCVGLFGCVTRQRGGISFTLIRGAGVTLWSDGGTPKRSLVCHIAEGRACALHRRRGVIRCFTR